MLDFEFIIKIAEEKIEKIKSDEDLIKLNIEHGWLQNDPNKSKQIELMDRYKPIAKQISMQNVLEDQKIITRKSIYYYSWRATELEFIVISGEEPFRFIYDDKNSPTSGKISSEMFEKYYKWCVLHNPTTKHLGFKLEKTFENNALVAQEYSLRSLISTLLYEVALNIGDGGAWEKIFVLKKYFVKEIINFMKKLNNDGVCNDPKLFSKFEKAEKLLNIIEENNFLAGK